jgi:hypothetical protein
MLRKFDFVRLKEIGVSGEKWMLKETKFVLVEIHVKGKNFVRVDGEDDGSSFSVLWERREIYVLWIFFVGLMEKRDGLLISWFCLKKRELEGLVGNGMKSDCEIVVFGLLVYVEVSYVGDLWIVFFFFSGKFGGLGWWWSIGQEEKVSFGNSNVVRGVEFDVGGRGLLEGERGAWWNGSQGGECLQRG